MTRYWWVSHNRTFAAEFGGGYLWSPKVSKKRFNQSYHNMTEVRPGDVIFSFAGSKIMGLGVAEGSAVTADRPAEFGKAGEAWETEGWLVPVRFTALEQPFRPADYMDKLGKLLPAKHSPLQASGRGNEAYLFEVPGPLAGAVLTLAGQDPAMNVDDAAASEALRNRKDLPATDKLQLINARVGQGLYRRNLEAIEHCCRVTGVDDRRFLIASHIKPWAVSSDAEKLDGNNGLLLAPHVDRLFDRGYITFRDDGTLLKRSDLPSTVLTTWNLDRVVNVGAFSGAQAKYLAYHRAEVFKEVR